MKISVNDQELFTLNEVKKQVICNDIPQEVIEDDLQRRIAYIIAHKYERCMERLRKEWTPKLKSKGIESVPLDDDAFAQLVFSQPDYMSRSARELENAPSQEEFNNAISTTQSHVQAQKNAEIAKL